MKVGADLFQCLIVVAQNKKIDLKKVLSYELSRVPGSLGRSDGSMNKGIKSQ